jgi:MFS transporter, DHA2 family, multidrug resistance protein
VTGHRHVSGGLFTIIEVPIVGYVLTKGFDPLRLIVIGMLIIALGIFWMSSLNLGVAERDLVIPRIVQVLGIGLVTVPLSTVVFHFLPKTESSQAACLYALMRNEGGSLGIALVSTMLQRKAQIHQQILGQNIPASNRLVQQYLSHQNAGNTVAERMLHWLSFMWQCNAGLICCPTWISSGCCAA